MTKSLFALLLAPLFWTAPTLARSGNNGNIVGNGVDHRGPFDNIAWFQNPSRAVKYCVKMDSRFQMEESTAHREIEAAFSLWKTYFEERTELALLPISRKFSRVSECGDADLKIYLGSSSPDVEKAREHLPMALAISQLEKISPENRWGAGLIWIANPKEFGSFPLSWSRPNALRGVMLHEIGHTLGLPHIAHTIMSPEISNAFIERAGRTAASQLGQIDWTNQIYISSSLRSVAGENFITPSASLAYQLSLKEGALYKSNLKLEIYRFDRSHIPKVSAELEFHSDELPSIKLRFVPIGPDTSFYEISGGVFRTFANNKNGSRENIVALPHESIGVFGTLVNTETGRSFVAILNLNQGGGQGGMATMRIMSDSTGALVEVFSSYDPLDPTP